MDIPETFTAILIAIVVFTLISASIEDIGTRTVRNGHWAVIGGFGVVFNLFYFAEDGILFGLTVSVMSAMILYTILNTSDRLGKTRVAIPGIVILLTVLSYVLAPSDAVAYSALSIPVFSGIFVLMYHAGLLKGGADAKCMVSLAIAFPAYPVFFNYPLINITERIALTVFPFSLAVLFLALLITLSATVPMFLMNLRKRNTGKGMFAGYVTDIETAKNSHVWPMHDIRDGKLMKINPTDNPEEIYGRLERHGKKDIWVTPMIPFIVPIAVSFVITAIFGNPMFLIL